MATSMVLAFPNAANHLFRKLPLPRTFLLGQGVVNRMFRLPVGARDFPARFQVSTAKQTKTALFWVMTQRAVVISCRRFGTTYRSHLQGSRIHSFGTHFCQRLIQPQGHSVAKELSQSSGVKNPVLWHSFLLEADSTPGPQCGQRG